MTVCLDVNVLIEKKKWKKLATQSSLKIVIMANLSAL